MKSGFISEEEFSKKKLLPLDGRKHPLRVLILSMKVKDRIFIDKTEFLWKGKTPQAITNEIKKEKHWGFEYYIEDDRGWYVTRVK